MTAAPDHVRRVLDRLKGVRQHGERRWAAHCPVGDNHNRGDRDASLSVLLTDETDRVQFNCHKGCRHEDVRLAIGVSVPDLYPARSRQRHQAEHLDYRYHDQDGTLRYVIRRRIATRGPRFYTLHPDAITGELINGGPDEPERFLYRLPQLIAADRMNGAKLWPVYITEGERDADNLAERCAPMLTTTVASGAWRNVDTTPLAGREVVVVVDNDPRGWTRGVEAADVAVAAGASLVDTMHPPWQFRDVSDMLAAGLDCDALEPVNLHSERPPTGWPEDESPTRPAANPRTGLAYFITSPVALLLALVQSGRLQRLDPVVWEVLEDRRFHDTNEAKATAVELAALLGRDRRTITASLHRLETVGLVKSVKRGRWLVMNPARKGRQGDVDLSVEVVPAPEKKPLSSLSNPSTPGKVHSDEHSAGPDAHSDREMCVEMNIRPLRELDR